MYLGLSFQTLISNSLYNSVTSDISDLLMHCRKSGHDPIHLCVGSNFLDMLVARKIYNATKRVPTSYQFFETKKKFYEKIEVSESLVKSQTKIKTLFDPDENYIALYFLNTNRKADPGEPQNEQGFPVEVARFHDEDLFYGFFYETLQQ